MMRNTGSRAFCLLLWALLATTSAAGQAQVAGWATFVTPVLGLGEPGAAFFPALFAQGSAVEILDPQGLEVHLIDVDGSGEEWVRPAGTAVVPPRGRWRLWLEGEWTMTPYTDVAVFPSARGWSRTSPMPMAVGPAGRVSVAEGAGEGELWLLYSGSPELGVRHELSRRKPVADSRDGVLMPAGTIVSAVWSPAANRYTSLSRPFELAAREVVEAPLERPGETGCWLVAYLECPAGEVCGKELADLTLEISRGDERHAADHTVTSLWGVYGFWYGLPPGPAVLEAGGEQFYLAARPLELAAGEIERVDGELRHRPSLEVGLVLPRELRRKPLGLLVRMLPDRRVLSQVELPRTAGRHRFEELQHGLLEVVLDTELGPFHRRVDLTDQDEAFVTLNPELIELFGKVSYAGEGHAATVGFQTVAGDQVAVESDEEGEYRAVTLHPLRWVTVTLDGVDQEPWRDFFAPPLATSRELDFDVPDARVEVRVVDAETRQGVPLARVAVRNEFVLPSEPGDESSGGRQRVLAQSYQTDDSGWTRLPPPRPGTIEVSASADGYRETAEPLVVEVADPPQDRQIELVLQPVGGGVGLNLKLADGSPAAGARVLLVESLTGGRPLFDGRADALGSVVVPAEHERGLLLLTHPKASFGIVEWSSWHDRERVDWSFPATPREQLSVRVMDASGRAPVAGAALSVWVGRWQLSGLSLRWLLAANPTTDADGLWTAEGLPRGPVRLLARAGEASAEAASAWENLATEATFPWPRPVELRVVR